MSKYRYKCIDAKGKLIKGQFFALNNSDLEDRLGTQGLTLISAKEIKESAFYRLLASSSVKPRILIEFYYRLSQTLELGLPLLSALAENAELLPSKTLASALTEIQVSIESGNTLHKSMSRFPKIFQRLDLAIIKMGEQTGVLPKSIKDLAEFLEWKEDIRSTIKRATIYPVIVITVIMAVLGVWVGYVLPQMAKMLSDMGIALPRVTQFVLTAGKFINNNWYWLLASSCIMVAGFYLLQKTQKGGIAVHKNFLSLPLLGKVATNIAVARLARNFATMYNSGISISYIFEILGRDVLGNRYLENRLTAAYEDIRKGESISKGFEKAGGFPPLFIGAIKNGETTGTIDSAFMRLGDYFDAEVKRTVQTMVNAIAPMTIILLGSVFGVIVLSIMLPLYDVLKEFK